MVLRGTTGFGAKQHLRTDRLLTLSEDLPLVAVGVDAPERVDAALRDVQALALRRARHARAARGRRAAARQRRGQAHRLHGPRSARTAPAYEAVVAALHRHGVAGATVLLGVDGTAHGERRRARFLGRNAGVPLMVVSVGEAAALAAALPEIAGLLERPIVTWERVRVCKRDGVTLDDAGAAPRATRGRSSWSTRAATRSISSSCGWLRATGAAGATTLRGVWGYHGDHTPHGESAWQLRRSAPVVTVVVDRPASVARWWGLARRADRRDRARDERARTDRASPGGRVG